MVVSGRIRLGPGDKKNTKDIIRWARYQTRLVINTALTRFSVVKASGCINRYKHHAAYIKKSKTIIETAKPEDFTNKVEWIEWYPTLINFLRYIPGRRGVPLSHICNPIHVIIRATYAVFINEYESKALLTGQL